MKKYTSSIFLILLLTLFRSSYGSEQTRGDPGFERFGIYDTDGITPQEYKERRAAVISLMDSGSIAIFHSSEPVRRNGDTEYKYRQDDDVLYLTGCTETNCTLLLSSNDIRFDRVGPTKEILFIREYKKTWSGYNLGLEGAKQILGFGAEGTTSIVLPIERMKDVVPQILHSTNLLYYTPPLPDMFFDQLSTMKFAAAREVRRGLQAQYPNLVLKGSGSLLNTMRSVKSSAEVVLMQKAITATVDGCTEAMKHCRTGMYEYELQAIIEYCFIRSGCEFYGFPTIVGSGPNTLAFHYNANRRRMNSGELVVMDLGAEYHGYSADVTRTIPVNGVYSSAQKEIYEVVLSAQNSALKEVRPGIPMNGPANKAIDVLGDGLIKLGIIQDKSETKKYCPHGISHFVGLDVHDVGLTAPLLPGMVLTIEPGLYIPDSSTCDKKYWGIGIRIEDDVLVTESGGEILSEAAPRSIEDIEAVMKQGNE